MNRSSFIQEFSGVYASPFLDTDKLKWLYGPEKFPGLSRNGPLVWFGDNTSRTQLDGSIDQTIFLLGRPLFNILIW